jgi:hypothetical protein
MSDPHIPTRAERERLRALAEKCVAGPWKHEQEDDGAFRVVADQRFYPWHICLVDDNIDEDIDGSAHAEYLAACSPSVVLSLLAALDEGDEWLRAFKRLAEMEQESDARREEINRLVAELHLPEEPADV